jgi:hypothetical protein
MIAVGIWCLPGMIAGAMLDQNEVGVIIGAVFGPLMVFVWVCDRFNQNLR